MTEPKKPINWREKFVATALHFLATLLLATIAAALIFFVWFPHPFETMIGGTELFMLVVGCDLALGPLVSLIIYDSRKTRRALITDYTIIGVLQLGAMIYGVTIVAGTRPVFVVFSTDRIEVVTARDILGQELEVAAPAYRQLPWTGPRLVSVMVPKKDQTDALFQSLAGNEEHQRPKFFVPFEAQIEMVRKRAKTLEALDKKHPGASALLLTAAADAGIPAAEVRWLPVRHRNGFWTTILDPKTFEPRLYVDYDPY